MLRGGMSSKFKTKSPISPQLLGAEEVADKAVEVEAADPEEEPDVCTDADC